MNKPKTTLTQAEYALYDLDKWAWAIYTAMKHAPSKDDKIVLWALMTPDQKAAIKLLAKRLPAGNQGRQEPAQGHQGPTHDRYGVKL